MKKLVSLTLAGLALLAAPAFAAEDQKDAKHIGFSFEGPFGTYDRQQLQRGYKVYNNVCASCHAMRLVSFRNLVEGGIFNDEEAKTLAASVTVKDAETESGERPGLLADRFPSPFATEADAKNANGGAVPPDMSLLAKSRPGWYGTFNQLWNGIGGPQYIYSVLTGYEEPSEELKKEQPEGKHYNPYFGAGHWIGMTPPLTDGVVEFDDGAPNKIDDMARDVSAFLMWAAEPKMEDRKRTGFMVMIYLAILSVLLYLVKKKDRKSTRLNSSHQ